MAKTHKRRDRKSSGRRLGQNRKNALNLLQTVRIGLLRFWSLRVHRRIARGVFPLKVILLLRQGENSADDALNVLECVPAEFAPSDLIEPRLNVIGSSVLQPDPLTQGVEVVFPDVLLSLRSRGPLVLHYPRQIIGEAKWLSSVGSAQGVNRDKDQIILRREFCVVTSFRHADTLSSLASALREELLRTSPPRPKVFRFGVATQRGRQSRGSIRTPSRTKCRRIWHGNPRTHGR